MLIVLKTLRMSLYYSQCSDYEDRTMESVYAAIQLARPQCAAAMQSICCKSGI